MTKAFQLLHGCLGLQKDVGQFSTSACHPSSPISMVHILLNRNLDFVFPSIKLSSNQLMGTVLNQQFTSNSVLNSVQNTQQGLQLWL